jgi:hypothetical protein
VQSAAQTDTAGITAAVSIAAAEAIFFIGIFLYSGISPQLYYIPASEKYCMKNVAVLSINTATVVKFITLPLLVRSQRGPIHDSR